MSIEITKARITKSRTVEVTLEESKNTDQGIITDEVTKKCSLLAHQDLMDALSGLVHHVIKITEFNDPENNSSYKVTGFVLSGADEEKGVTITAQKKLESGMTLNLNTPLAKFEGLAYQGCEELEADVQRCVDEVELYLDGKCAIKQVCIDFDSDDEEAGINVGDAQPKKRGRKKKEIASEPEPEPEPESIPE